MTEAEQILAEELTFDLDDEGSKAYHQKIVKIYEHDFLRHIKMKVLLLDNVKNKGAYFNTLVSMQGEKHKKRTS